MHVSKRQIFAKRPHLCSNDPRYMDDDDKKTSRKQDRVKKKEEMK